MAATDIALCIAAAKESVRHPSLNTVSASSHLYISEPPPSHFGNDANTAAAPGWTNDNWLKSRFHFSFAEYNSASNSDFGVLRVCNDDLVQPARGFGKHGHGDMEIVTFIVTGQLTHADSTGTSETLGRGDIQFMTAGRGVRHSERNLAEADPTRFIQMWITPRRRGLAPNYGSALGDAVARQDGFAHLAGDVDAPLDASGGAAVSGEGPAVRINQDVNIHVAELSAAGNSAHFTVAADRQAYVLCIEGGVVLTGAHCAELEGAAKLGRHDAAEIFGPSDLTFIATGAQPSREIPGEGAAGMVLVVEMERDGSSRFS